MSSIVPGPLKNGKRELFAQGMVAGKGVLQAYKEAGYSGAGKGSIVNASKMAHSSEVAARVAELKNQIGEGFVERAIVTQEEVLNELKRIGFSNLRKAAEWNNGRVHLFDSRTIDDDTAAAISEVSEGKEGVKIKLHNKFAALEALGRHLGLFADQVEVRHEFSGDIKSYIEEKLLGNDKLIDITPTEGGRTSSVTKGPSKNAAKHSNRKRS